MKHVSSLIISVLLTLTLFAQDENPPMITDRPTQTESSFTVPQKTFQIESGFTFGYRNQESIESWELGYIGTNFRYGAFKRLEVRLGLAYAGVETTDAATEETTRQSGMAPLAIGIKWNILEGDGPIPTLALLTSVDIPALASDNFNDGNVLNRILLAGSWDLSNTFSLGFNFGTIADWKQSDFTTLYSTSLAMNIVKWMGAFVELYGFLPAGEYDDHRLHAGFTFPVRHNLQFDLTGGIGYSKNSPDGFGGFGFAWRIPR